MQAKEMPVKIDYGTRSLNIKHTLGTVITSTRQVTYIKHLMNTHTYKTKQNIK